MDLAGLLSVEVDADLEKFDDSLDTARAKSEAFGKSGAKPFRATTEAARKANREVVDFGRNAAKAGTQSVGAFTRLKNIISAIPGPIKAIGVAFVGAFAVREIISATDRITAFQNSLKVTGLEGQKLAEVQTRLINIANQNGVAIGDLGQLYSRASLAANTLGASQEQLIGLVEGVAAALRVSGQSTEAASGALLQLSQALGAGVVRAEEFNSILEGAPEIARAAAQGLYGTRDATAELRSAVVEGEITSKQFFQALQIGFEETKRRAEGLPLTIQAGMQTLRNGFDILVTSITGTSGAAEALALTFQKVGQFMTSIAPAAANIGAIIGTVFSTATSIIGGFMSILSTLSGGFLNLERVITAVGVALGAIAARSAISFFISLIAQVKGATTAMGALNMVIRANPIALVVSAVYLLVEAFIGWDRVMEAVKVGLDALGKVLLKGQKWFVDLGLAALDAVDTIINAVNKIPGINIASPQWTIDLRSDLEEKSAILKQRISEGGDDAAMKIKNGMNEGADSAAKKLADGIASGVDDKKDAKGDATKLELDKKTADAIAKAIEMGFDKALKAFQKGMPEAGEKLATPVSDGVQAAGQAAGSSIADIMQARAQIISANSASMFKAAGIELSNTSAAILRRAGHDVAAIMKSAIHASIQAVKAQADLLKAQAELFKAQAATEREKVRRSKAGLDDWAGGGGGGGGGSSARKSGGIQIYNPFAKPETTKSEERVVSSSESSSTSVGGDSGQHDSGGVTIVNVHDSEGYVNALNTAGGNQAIINVVKNNRDTLRALLGVA